MFYSILTASGFNISTRLVQVEVDLFELLCKVLDQNLFAQVDWARNSYYFKELKVRTKNNSTDRDSEREEEPSERLNREKRHEGERLCGSPHPPSPPPLHPSTITCFAGLNVLTVKNAFPVPASQCVCAEST
jgi:hypothetical protein